MNKFAHLHDAQKELLAEVSSALEAYEAGHAKLRKQSVRIQESLHQPRLIAKYPQGEVQLTVSKSTFNYSITGTKTTPTGDTKEVSASHSNLMSAVFEAMSELFPPMLLS